MFFLYFDPGLGAMIIQVIVASVAAVVLFSKSVIYKIKLFLGLAKDVDDEFDDIGIENEDVDKKTKSDK